MPLPSDDDVLVYTEGGTKTHILKPQASPNAYSDALCGRSSWPQYWFGTGSQAEWERARSQELCTSCMAILRSQADGD